MTPCIVSPSGEIIYEAFDCDDAFNELRKWFMANMDEIHSKSIPLLHVIDIDTERPIKRDKDKGYYLG